MSVMLQSIRFLIVVNSVVEPENKVAAESGVSLFELKWPDVYLAVIIFHLLPLKNVPVLYDVQYVRYYSTPLLQ